MPILGTAETTDAGVAMVKYFFSRQGAEVTSELDAALRTIAGPNTTGNDEDKSASFSERETGRGYRLQTRSNSRTKSFSALYGRSRLASCSSG